ncbi:hypothetical protein ACO0LF_26270 [Undibacterium sp. Di27W]|uniref:hypothetical protein n=1 Tax=Undibacterium sp. Di27W TaxID=3413036 RepID=UPI003BEF895E
MYYLTIEKNGVKICDHQPFDDYAAAILACSEHYKSRVNRGVLSFTTETINGVFARSYAELNRPEHISVDDDISKYRYSTAAKYTNSFDYQDSVFFLIESATGIDDANS